MDMVWYQMAAIDLGHVASSRIKKLGLNGSGVLRMRMGSHVQQKPIFAERVASSFAQVRPEIRGQVQPRYKQAVVPDLDPFAFDACQSIEHVSR